MKKFITFLLLLSSSSLLLLSPAHAQTFCSSTSATGGVATALGCLSLNPSEAISSLLGWAVIVGGGVAFLLIIYAGFSVGTAQGDPKKMQAGQELLTTAISGLLLIIFSVVILNVIGVNILGLNRYGFTF